MNHQEFSSKGGQSRATKLSKARLTDIARMAAVARWKAKACQTMPDIPKPLISNRRCQSAHCTKEGREVLVQGMKAWLCEQHG